MEYHEIKKLMDDMGNSKLTELEIEFPSWATNEYHSSTSSN